MQKSKNILLFFILFVILPTTTYADCNSDFEAVKNDFKESYKYNSETDDFNVILVNPDYEKYTFGYHSQDEVKKVEMKYDGKKATVTIKNVKENKYDYAFIAQYSECKYQVAKSGSIELKKYNPYSDSELCKGNEDFVLCQRDYDKAIDEETFKSRLETYTKTKEIESTTNDIVDNNENKSKSNILNTIINYIQENTVQVIIIGLLILILIISVVVYIINLAKRRRLE